MSTPFYTKSEACELFERYVCNVYIQFEGWEVFEHSVCTKLKGCEFFERYVCNVYIQFEGRG